MTRELDPCSCWFVEDERGGLDGPMDEDEARARAHETGGTVRYDEARTERYYMELEREAYCG